MELIKLKPPVQIDGRTSLRSPLGDVIVEHVIITGFDQDGYVCIEMQPSQNPSSGNVSAHKLGTVQARKLTYNVFPSANDFDVLIQGNEAKRTLRRHVTMNFIIQVFRNIPDVGITFNKIRLHVKAIDSLQTKSALAVLEVTKHVECIRESNRTYYRRLKPWSLDISK